MKESTKERNNYILTGYIYPALIITLAVLLIGLLADIAYKNPDAYTLCMRQADYYLNQGQYFEAIDELTVALALNPDSQEAYESRSIAYNHLGMYTESLSDSLIAQSLEPPTRSPVIPVIPVIPRSR